MRGGGKVCNLIGVARAHSNLWVQGKITSVSVAVCFNEKIFSITAAALVFKHRAGA